MNQLFPYARRILCGYMIALLFCAAGLVTSGVLLYATSMKLSSAPYVLLGFLTFGSGISGYCCSSVFRKRGLLIGMAAGIFYLAVVMTGLVLLSGETECCMRSCVRLLLPLAFSSIGGIIGVGNCLDK